MFEQHRGCIVSGGDLATGFARCTLAMRNSQRIRRRSGASLHMFRVLLQVSTEFGVSPLFLLG